MDCHVWFRDEPPHQEMESEYLGVLLTSAGKMEHEMEGRLGAASEVLQVLSWTVALKIKLSQKG